MSSRTAAKIPHRPISIKREKYTLFEVQISRNFAFPAGLFFQTSQKSSPDVDFLPSFFLKTNRHPPPFLNHLFPLTHESDA